MSIKIKGLANQCPQDNG